MVVLIIITNMLKNYGDTMEFYSQNKIFEYTTQVSENRVQLKRLEQKLSIGK